MFFFFFKFQIKQALSALQNRKQLESSNPNIPLMILLLMDSLPSRYYLYVIGTFGHHYRAKLAV